MLFPALVSCTHHQPYMYVCALDYVSLVHDCTCSFLQLAVQIGSICLSIAVQVWPLTGFDNGLHVCGTDDIIIQKFDETRLRKGLGAGGGGDEATHISYS